MSPARLRSVQIVRMGPVSLSLRQEQKCTSWPYKPLCLFRAHILGSQQTQEPQWKWRGHRWNSLNSRFPREEERSPPCRDLCLHTHTASKPSNDRLGLQHLLAATLVDMLLFLLSGSYKSFMISSSQCVVYILHTQLIFFAIKYNNQYIKPLPS